MENENELESLLSLLRDADPVVRRNAIHDLRTSQDPRVMIAFRDIVLDDKDIECRKRALWWLHENNADKSILTEAFLHALEDDSFRLWAALGICRVGKRNPELVEPLICHLENNQHIAFPMIIDALGIVGDRRAYKPIAAYLHSTNSYHRGLAAQALGELGDDQAIEPLTALLSDQAIAWKEDYGPERSVAFVAEKALRQLKGKG